MCVCVCMRNKVFATQHEHLWSVLRCFLVPVTLYHSCPTRTNVFARFCCVCVRACVCVCVRVYACVCACDVM